MNFVRKDLKDTNRLPQHSAAEEIEEKETSKITRGGKKRPLLAIVGSC
jgi:hypothetical protein